MVSWRHSSPLVSKQPLWWWVAIVTRLVTGRRVRVSVIGWRKRESLEYQVRLEGVWLTSLVM